MVFRLPRIRFRGWLTTTSGRRARPRATVSLAVLALLAAMLVAPAADQMLPAATAPAVHDLKRVHASRVPYTPYTPAHMPAFKPGHVRWPSGTALATLPASVHVSSLVRAGTLPVWIGPAATRPAHQGSERTPSHHASNAKSSKTASTPLQVRVGVASRSSTTAAGVSGIVVTLRHADGSTRTGRVRVSVGYASFRNAYGADWASRLRLVTLPACALTTPGKASCRRQTPITFTTNTKTRRLTAEVTLAATSASSPSLSSSSQSSGTGQAPMAVLAADASASGGAGDYTATSLQPSGAWQAGGSTDSFTWSYPITVPEAPGGLTPNVSLSYDSQSQDGLTSSTNNQASMVGDGWDYSPGFIERSYRSCHDNPAGSTQTWDDCWSANNSLTLSLNGTSTTLVKDDTTGAWHAQNDANEKIEHLTGASNADNDGEYWRITTDDGTQYYFGLNQLPGYASGDATTKSAWTEPVYATASGQPCYNATFADSWCQQAWRWNLDYVVDTHSDAVSYFYSPGSNYYARDLGTTANTSYNPGGHLVKILYGQRDGQVYSTSPAGQVLFTVNGRCDTSADGCATSTLTSSTASDWPDVPYDLKCTNGSSCGVQSPTFWTLTMDTTITTQALMGSTETTVDSWTLKHSFPATGDATDPSLWLTSIQHTGNDTTAGGSSSSITLPKVSFSGTALSNRVDTTDGYPPITRHRLSQIITETGEKISVNYSAALSTSDEPSDPSTNTTLAFPDYWTPTGQISPILDWFNKYIVTHVSEQDPYGGSANDDVVTTYTPVGNPAWHYNDNPTTPANRRTWDQWRGYQGMTVSTGTAPDPVTKTTYTYFRGMDGDTLPNGTRSVSVTDSRGDSVTDSNQYAGTTFETRVFNGSTLVTDTITYPWTSSATASQALSGLPTLKAFHTGSAKTRAYTPLASGSTQETETDYTHDTYGRVVKTNDLGDVSISGDDLCTTTSYADNSTAWILDTPSEVDTVAVNCSTTPTLPDDVVSDVLTFYDESTTLGAAPTVGDATMVKQAASYADGTPTYVTMSTTTVDEYGRPVSETDADNRTTKTTYTPVTGAEPNSIAVTDPMGLATTTTYDPLRDLAVAVTDPAGYVTHKQYDALGRLTGAWNAGRDTSQAANVKYTYAVNNDSPSVVDTDQLNEDGTYRVSETLYDSMLRARETQVQTPDNERDVTDTVYNTDGWVSETEGPYVDASPVSTTLVQAQPGDVSSETGYTYDGAGRKTAEIAYSYATETWRTTYTYGGNFVTTVPPAGATPTTTVTDARGNTTDLIAYHSGAPTDYVNDPASDYDDTDYTWTPAGQQASMTDPAGNTWSWAYNLLGQQTDAYDPDTGHTTSVYDNAGQPISTTDARGAQTTYTYDQDGRTTGEYDTTSTQTLSTSNQLAGWTYDTVKKGLPASTTSYSGGDTITSTILGYNLYENVAGQKITITGTDAGLLPSGGLTFSYGYTTATDLPNSEQDPAWGGLPLENVDTGYDAFGQPDALSGTSNTVGASYVRAVGYSELGQPLQYTLGTAGTVYATLTYDEQTQALTDIRTTDSTFSGDVDNLSYTYGNSTVSQGAGLITKTVDKQNAGTTVDTQCFTYDYADRLQQAWTATDACAATPTNTNSSTVGGPDPYWQSWTYDTAGNRATQTDHDTTGIGGDTVTSYQYPTQGSASDQPNTLTSTTATGPDATANTATYTYNAVGDTTSMAGGATGDQTLTWNSQGQLATDTTANGTTNYVYNADGSLFIRRDPSKTTLFIGDEQLVLDAATGTLTGSRYYTINGTTVAMRVSDSTWYELIPDRQGTDTLAINDNSQAVTRRSYTPFGQARTTPDNWPGDTGYVGGTPDDTTGLENMGAREYDPQTGRFISPDPVLETSDPRQLNGYDYAANDPATGSDPTGQMLACGGLGGSSSSLGCMDGSTTPTGGNSDYVWGGPGKHSTSKAPTRNRYIPISPHVYVQKSDPHYHSMESAYNAYLRAANINENTMTEKQEFAIWEIVCGTTRDVCGNFTSETIQLQWDSVYGGGTRQPTSRTFFLIGSAFKDTGGWASVVVLGLKYKPGWTPEQRAAADAKVAKLNEGKLVVTKVARGGSARRMMKAAGMSIDDDEDADHIVDLQLGGADDVTNVWALDTSVNRSLGPQINQQIKKWGLSEGDPVDGVTITDGSADGEGVEGGGGE